MIYKYILPVFLAIGLQGCLGLPKGVEPVKNFQADRYLGKWYEIARLDHSFERGLSQVTADYSLRPDGGIKVANRGFSAKDQQWKEAEGKAYFVRGKDEGFLKVSFFGPFYSSYAVFELDQSNYQYAFVSGANTSFLWLLSRSPSVSQEVKDRFLQRAKELGYDSQALIFVEQKP